MIPSEWVPVRREQDGEIVGYLAPDDEPNLVVPMTLLGTALADAIPEIVARRLVGDVGLSSLDAAWYCRLPRPLTHPVRVDAATSGWQWRRVVIVEASPIRCSIRLALAADEEMRLLVSIPVPVGDALSGHD